MTFFGIPPSSSAGSYTILLTIRDPYNGQVVDDFVLKINSRPDVPTVGPYSNIDKVFTVP
jgi:hypothetical protein